MTNNDIFLETYKKLETEMRSFGKSILDYENDLSDGAEKEKLKVCRIIRNYMAHQDKKFVDISNDMINFISDLELQIRRRSHIVANELIRQKAVAQNESLKNILPLIVKNVVPVQDKAGKIIYIIDENTYLTMLNKGLKKIELPKRLPKLNYVNKDYKISNLATGIYIVTSDGTDSGKYLGLCII